MHTRSAAETLRSDAHTYKASHGHANICGFLTQTGWPPFGAAAGLVAPPTPVFHLNRTPTQLLIINVEDQDFRDMLFDYRVTRPGVRCVASSVWGTRLGAGADAYEVSAQAAAI